MTEFQLGAAMGFCLSIGFVALVVVIEEAWGMLRRYKRGKLEERYDD